MKKYIWILCPTIFLISLKLPAQRISQIVEYIKDTSAQNDTLISYQPDLKLTWKDFEGTTTDKSEVAALTMSGFGYKLKYSSLGNKVDLIISVFCNFVKKDSWVKPEKNTPYILNHEQHHFDIANIQARLFEKKLKALNLPGKGFAQIIENTYREYKTAMGEMQDQYDAETKHSRIIEQQELWDKKIDGLLEKVNGE